MNEALREQMNHVLSLSMLSRNPDDSRMVRDFQEMLQFAQSLCNFPHSGEADEQSPELTDGFCPLREDCPGETFTQAQVFLNAPSVQDGQLLLPRVL